jgi:hypothetical protein
MPLGNFSDFPEAAEEVLTPLLSSLEKNGYEVVEYQDVYDFLLRNRLREMGTVSRSTARRIGKRFGAQAILVGSVNIYRPNEGYPLLGLSFRMVNSADGASFWAQDVSYSGEDFRFLFDFGTIKKMDELRERALNDLVRKFPSHVPSPSKLPPVELEKIMFDRRVKGGEKIEVIAYLTAIDEEPSGLTLTVGKEIKAPLRKDRNGLYRALVESPQEEGDYPLKIRCCDGERRWSINPGAWLTVDNTPPVVKISALRTVISPNGINNRKFRYTPVLLENKSIEPIKRWKFVYEDPQGREHPIYQVYGTFPSMIYWNGWDEQNRIVFDGTYRLKLVAEDEAGNSAESDSVTLEVDATPPLLHVSGKMESNGNWKKAYLRISVEDSSPIKNYHLEVYGKKKERLESYEGDGMPPKKLVLEKVPLDLELLTYKLVVNDAVENRGEISGEITVTKKKRKRKKLKFR